MPSLREHGLRVGGLEPGRLNAITDVPGVRVGHVTVACDEPHVLRTGVTAIAPGRLPATAGAAVLNGAGEMTGFLQVSEWGVLETAVHLTATMAVGRVYDGAVAAAMAADPAVGVKDVLIPVVAECDDSWLSDARALGVEPADAGRALAGAARVFAAGAVGAGTGMVCFRFKGGIGTASRVAGDHAVGALVLANFGAREDLRIDGVPVGRLLAGAQAEPARPRAPAGSCIAVLATDAPLAAADLTRLARRAGLGLARTGSVAHHGSGEIFLASSVAPAPGAAVLDPLFAAAVEATEEAVYSALWSARTTTGRAGRVARALPHDATLELLRAHRRLG